MSDQIKASELKQSRASKIQIEVKNVAPQTTSKNSMLQLSADADGGDISNE
jgi:hypothetical protein